jgi:hypothetical protein
VKILVVLRTLNRAPKANFLGHTMVHLYRSGLWSSPHLHSFHVIDSGSEDQASFFAEHLYPWVPITITPGTFSIDAPATRRTHNENATAAWVRAARWADEVDWVLNLEDDIDVCASFLGSVARWLERFATDEQLLYTFGSTWPGVGLACQNGLSAADVPIAAFYGAQAYAVRAKYAAPLATWLKGHLTYHGALDASRRHQSHDLLLHDWARATEPSAMFFRASAPSFVQHTGRVSALNNPFFEFPTWPGRRWRFE